MMATDTTPRAWVGCLACYNAGELVGVWVEGVEAGEVEADPAAYGLTAHATPGHPKHEHEEWWVFDHEGYGPALRNECSPAEAQRIAEALEDIPESEREAFAAYLDHRGDLEDALETFEEAYAGEWDSEEHFAADLLESIGELRDDSLASRYFDYAAFARDLFMSDYFSAPAPGMGVYVFRGDV